jgi:hypothetical protein
MTPESQNLGVKEMSQRYSLPSNIKHQLSVITYYDNEGTVEGGDFVSVSNKLIYKQRVN